MRAVSDDVPSLDDLMPWSAPALRLGRTWVTAPDAATLHARWRMLTQCGDAAERLRLFGPTRTRGTDGVVAQLPGGHPATGPICHESGPCPVPVPFLRGGWEHCLVLPDNRLIDAARPQVWRVADAAQFHAVVAGGELDVCAVLPEGRSAAGRAGRIRPLYRRPGGLEPNVAPGLLALLGRRLGREVPAAELLAWAAAAWRPAPRTVAVPLPADTALWEAGIALGGEVIDARTRGSWSGERPRLPGGRRPYVRVPLPPRPDGLAYDAATETLSVGTGAVAPVPRAVWEFTSDGVRVVEAWFASRAGPWQPQEDAGEAPDGQCHPEDDGAPADGGTSGGAASRVSGAAAPPGLDAVGPDSWQREWTTQLLDLLTTVGLLTALERRRRALAEALARGPLIGAADLRAAGVLPVPAAARRPASVLDHHEEGPGGQLSLV